MREPPPEPPRAVRIDLDAGARSEKLAVVLKRADGSLYVARDRRPRPQAEPVSLPQVLWCESYESSQRSTRSGSSPVSM